MDRLDAAIKAEADDWKQRFLDSPKHGYFPERSQSLSKEVLGAAAEKWGEVWVGSRIPAYNGSIETAMVQYANQVISDDWDFMVPCDDLLLRQLIVGHRHQPLDAKNESWSNIKKRIAELKGLPF